MDIGYPVMYGRFGSKKGGRENKRFSLPHLFFGGTNPLFHQLKKPGAQKLIFYLLEEARMTASAAIILISI